MKKITSLFALGLVLFSGSLAPLHARAEDTIEQAARSAARTMKEMTPEDRQKMAAAG